MDALVARLEAVTARLEAQAGGAPVAPAPPASAPAAPGSVPASVSAFGALLSGPVAKLAALAKPLGDDISAATDAFREAFEREAAVLAAVAACAVARRCVVSSLGCSPALDDSSRPRVAALRRWFSGFEAHCLVLASAREVSAAVLRARPWATNE